MKIRSLLTMCVLVFSSCGVSTTTKEFISPDKSFVVELTETVKPGYDYIVSAKIKMNNSLIVNDANFAVREEDDGRHFDFLFFKTEWVEKNILKFTDERNIVKDTRLEYFIVNKAKSTISYLWVGNFSEEFLVFGLEPQQQVFIRSKVSADNQNGIYLKRVVFDSGRKIDRQEKRFEKKSLNKRYMLTIEDAKVAIDPQPYL